MNIKSKTILNMQGRTKLDSMSAEPMSISPISRSTSSPFNNQYQERPLKTNSQDLSFKGLSVSIESSKIIESFGSIIGKAAAANVEKIIKEAGSKKNPWMEVNNGNIIFKKESLLGRVFYSIIDPVINFPIDLTNATLGGLKRFKLFKKSAFIDKLLNNKILKTRKDHLTSYSNAMAIQHHAEMLDDIKELKIKATTPEDFEKIKEAEQNIISEAQKRLSPEIANYTTKAERSFTRIASGIVPAFFLANDAYNLSMYMNNNKEMAKKEKKRRFDQEIIRVALTAVATFGALGFFAKKSNANTGSATYIVAAITLVSEIVGRMITGVPFYPITSKQAKKYSQKENKNKLEETATNKNTAIESKDKKDAKTSSLLKLIGAIMLTGLAIEKIPMHIKPVKQLLDTLCSKYQSLLDADYIISKKEFNGLIDNLKDNGFDELAQDYKDQVDKIIAKGNLTAKESYIVDRELTKRSEKDIPDFFIKNPKEYKEEITELKNKLSRKDIMAELNIKSRSDEEMLHLGRFVSKPKSAIDQILGLPIRVVWDIINMPYKYVVKPLMELPKQISEKSFASKDKKSKYEKSPLQNSLLFLRKINNDVDYKEKLNNALLDSFDNVSKSNFSNAELGGAAKTAVSTVTSAFLVFDNYNRVMIDSQGKDKDLAGQKSQERTIQRIVRIAYGAGLIKLFGNVFSRQYNGSLLGAQMTNVGQSIVTETLERASVGLPLHEATREEIIENDKKNVEASGIKGGYFKLIAALTGKKPLSEMNEK